MWEERRRTSDLPQRCRRHAAAPGTACDEDDRHIHAALSNYEGLTNSYRKAALPENTAEQGTPPEPQRCRNLPPADLP